MNWRDWLPWPFSESHWCWSDTVTVGLFSACMALNGTVFIAAGVMGVTRSGFRVQAVLIGTVLLYVAYLGGNAVRRNWRRNESWDAPKDTP